MSCSFWNMRRRLRAQQQADKIKTNFVEPVKEKTEEPKTATKTVKKGGAKNDSTAD